MWPLEMSRWLAHHGRIILRGWKSFGLSSDGFNGAVK